MRLYYWRGGRTMTCAGPTLLVLALCVVVRGEFSIPHAHPERDPHITNTNQRSRDGPNTHSSAPSSTTTTTADTDNYNTANIKPPSDVIRAFESSLLKMFGLKNRPRPSRKIHIPQYMLDLYKTRAQNFDELSDSYNVHGTNTYSANTIRSFFHSEDEENRHHQGDISGDVYKRRFYFNMTGLPQDEMLKAAEFRLYRHTIHNSSSSPSEDGPLGERTRSDNSDNTLPQDQQTNFNTRRKYSKQKIAIYEVIRPATKTREAITRLLDTRLVESWRTNWESFDIRPAVLKWREAPHRNHGLEVHIQGHGRALPALTDSSAEQPHVRLRRSLNTSEKQWQKQKPLLVTYSDDATSSSKSRSKRRARHKKRSRSWSKKHRKDECRRHHLYVDFGDVGWNDWIVAPPGYEAFYCSGECGFPLPEYINTTNHAIVQTLVHSVSPQAVPKPCCVPTELSPISMLYLDESEKVVLKNYQDMVVVGCGCR